MDWKIPATIIILIMVFIAFTKVDTGISSNNIVGQILEKAKKVGGNLFSFISSEHQKTSHNISFSLSIRTAATKPFSVKDSNIIIDNSTKIYGFNGIIQFDDTLRLSGKYKKMEINGMLLSTAGNIEQSSTKYKEIKISNVVTDRIFFSAATGNILINKLNANLNKNDVTLKNAEFAVIYNKKNLVLEGNAETIEIDDTVF